MATRVEQPAGLALPSPDCLAGNLGWLLGKAKHALHIEFEQALKPLGISSRDYFVLATALGEDHTQIGLSKLVGLDKTTMVVTLDALEAAGLAERMPSSTDRRVRVVVVTKAGARKVAEARKLVEQVQINLLERLPESERTGLLEGLAQLVSECDQIKSDAP